MNGLGLDSATRSQGLELIPAGTVLELTMKLKAGGIGLEGLCTRSSKGDCEGINVEYVVTRGEHEGRKLHAFCVLGGATAGHERAGQFTRALLRAIFEAVNEIDPNDNSAATKSRLASAPLSSFDGATFLAEVKIERGGPKPDGGTWPDKNVVGKVLRPEDPGYRKLAQPPPAPIEGSSATVHHFHGAPTGGVVAKPGWAS